MLSAIDYEHYYNTFPVRVYVIPYFLVILRRQATVFWIIWSFSVDNEPSNFKLAKETSLAEKIGIFTLMILDIIILAYK